jgi:hypothetical protein
METNNISIMIEIEEVLRINDKDYSITFSTYFNVEWKESEPKDLGGNLHKNIMASCKLNVKHKGSLAHVLTFCYNIGYVSKVSCKYLILFICI